MGGGGGGGVPLDPPLFIVPFWFIITSFMPWKTIIRSLTSILRIEGKFVHRKKSLEISLNSRFKISRFQVKQAKVGQKKFAYKKNIQNNTARLILREKVNFARHQHDQNR